MKIVGDVVGEWIDKTLKHYGGPVKTIVFSATVDHGEELCKQFNAAGFNFQQISYRDANEERRRELIAEFRKEDSEIDGLVSCEVFTKGFDVPDIKCGSRAGRTASLSPRTFSSSGA
jgi:DNA repair protein RadD